MSVIFGFIMILAAVVSCIVGRKKGYSGVLFAIGGFIFPFLGLIVFALPDKAQQAKNTNMQSALEENIKKQQRMIEKMNARIRELENQQKESSRPEAKIPEKPVIKEETKPDIPEKPVIKEETMPEVHEKPVYTAESGRKVNFKVENDGDLANILSILKIARECYREKNYSLALMWFEKVANAEHLESQMRCGEMYYFGQGREVNYEKALYWYEKAAQQGDPVGQRNCAFMYKEGTGCAINFKKAFYWYEKAAQQGDAEAQFNVGMMYELGRGCEADLEKARYWYEKAAAQGDAGAQRLLDGMQ